MSVYLAIGVGTTVVIASQILLFVMQLKIFRQQRVHEAMMREADAEERRMIANKVAATSEALKKHTEVGRQEVLSAIQSNTEQTKKATEAAHEAYKEANNVNVKIEDLNKRLLEEQKKKK